jgi:hypothetical protein
MDDRRASVSSSIAVTSGYSSTEVHIHHYSPSPPASLPATRSRSRSRSRSSVVQWQNTGRDRVRYSQQFRCRSCSPQRQARGPPEEEEQKGNEPRKLRQWALRAMGRGEKNKGESPESRTSPSKLVENNSFQEISGPRMLTWNNCRVFRAPRCQAIWVDNLAPNPNIP